MNGFDFDDVLRKAAALPREINPQRDLWPEINAQLAATREKPARVASHVTWFLRLGIAAAVLALVIASGFWVGSDQAPAWNIAALAGVPSVDTRGITGVAKWRRGQWLETDATSRARLAVANIGEVNLEPNSRLRLLRTAANDHRLQLARGTLHALIWAPPRIFFVETPSATAIDLGCEYTLTVDDSGASRLQVTSGYVALEHGDHEVLIPAGLMCITRPNAGPGTPFSGDSAPAFRDALQHFDFDARGRNALPDVLSHAATGDQVTLWHLLMRTADEQRAAVFDKLASLHPPPRDITRDGILAGRKDMLDRWAVDLGLTPSLSAR